MAKYLERLDGLLEDGTISQEIYDELADLSVAKDAIKEFNQTKRERDEFEQRIQHFESAPKRKAALEQFGVDYDTAPKYLRTVFDDMDTEKLEDREYVSQYLRDNEIDVQVDQEGQKNEDEPTGAERIVSHALSAPLKGKRTSKGTTAADFASWDHQRKRDFIKEHPREFEQIKRGETVSI